MPTDAERAIELAEWNESLSQSLVPNSMADHRHRDTSRLLREYAGMADELLRLREVVAKLGVTADGMPAIPEIDCLFHPKYPDRLFMALNAEDAADFVSPAGACDVVCPISECYSTREAAEAAEAAKGDW
jgi:hypothetical protein